MSKIVKFSIGWGREAIVDEADWPLIKDFSWRWSPRKGNSDLGYVIATTSRKSAYRGTIALHRFLMGTPKDKHVDHVNGDRLDNRRENLRLASRSQNMFNVAKRPGFKSQFKGVAKVGTKWRAGIQFNKKTTIIGIFEHEWEAALAYDMVAFSLYPEFARTNFPKGFVELAIKGGPINFTHVSEYVGTSVSTLQRVYLHSRAEHTKGVNAGLMILGGK